MKLRKLTPADFLPMQNNMNIAFRFDRSETPVDKNNEVDFSYGAFTDEGVMTSSVIGNPYRCSYWGSTVGMCGVGGVATFPEYRREGHMRKLIPFVLQEAYKRGDVLSSLFPFSHPFYRKFGFECGYPLQHLEMGMDAFSNIPFTGKVKQYMPGDDLTEIKTIYAEFQKKHNFLCDRDDGYWQHRLGKDPYVTHHHTYIWYDEDGKAQAYCLMSHDQDGSKKSYNILDCAFTTPSAFYALCGFFRLLTPSAESMSFKLPQDVNPFCIFPEPYDITVTTRNCGMVRVVNAAEALRLHPWNKELSGFTIRITDADISENQHTFRVRCGDAVTVSVDDTAEADLEVSIQALSVLLCGVLNLPTALANRRDIKLLRDVPGLLDAFPVNPGLIVENF